MNFFETSIFRKFGWISSISLLFVVLNSLLVANDWYYLSILPFIFFIIYISLVSLDKLIYLVVFFVPVSLPLENFAPELGFNLQLPTEPILAWILVLFILRLLYEKRFDTKILLHPVSIAIYVNLTWMLITCITSSMPLVSFKFLTARLWFLASFYFIATRLFVTKKGIRTYVWAIVPMMVTVCVYAISRLAPLGFFNQQAAHLSASPFFNDHTSYGCLLAMLIPFITAFAALKRYSTPFLIFCILLLMFLLFAFVFSYTRAAWISLAVAFAVFILIEVRIRFTYLVFALIILAGVLYLNRQVLFYDLEKNRQNSSKDLVQHLKSMSNIRTDDSNVERLNRWKSAIRMFKERPVLGWGPGTYMFQYAPYQLWKDKTSISTNRGDRGNAHSEYIGSLVESGVFGAISFILIGVFTIFTGVRTYSQKGNNLQVRILSLAATLGLITYYTHAFLNNFLDTDKASALFWGFTAMIVSLDVYHRENS